MSSDYTQGFNWKCTSVVLCYMFISTTITFKSFNSKIIVQELALCVPLNARCFPSTFLSSDMVYCGVYDNNLDNEKFTQAKGFNYHQGPVSKRAVFSTWMQLFWQSCCSLWQIWMQLFWQSCCSFWQICTSFSGMVVARWLLPACQALLCQENGKRDIWQNC